MSRVSGVDVRVADAERDLCISRLQHHFEVGRLEQRELEERVETALLARNRSQLDALTSDCEDVAPPVSRPRPRRARAWVVGLVGALALGGVVLANVPSAPAQAPTCAATGLVTPVDVDCPLMTAQQERLLQDRDRAVAAADQVEGLAAAARWDERLAALDDDARVAVGRAQEAVADAQVVVATAEGEVGKHDLDDAARKARSAAADAARIAIEATQVAAR